MELKKEAFEAAKPSIIGLVVLTLFKMGIVILMPDSAIAVLSGLPCDLVFWLSCFLPVTGPRRPLGMA